MDTEEYHSGEGSLYTHKDPDLSADDRYDMGDDQGLWEDDIPESDDLTFYGEPHHYTTQEEGSGEGSGGLKGSRTGHRSSHSSHSVEHSSHSGRKRRSPSRRQSGKRRSDGIYVDRNGVVHSHQPASTSRHHHRRLRRWKRVLLVIGIVLALLVVLIFGAWKVLDAVGRTRLYQQGNNAAPTLAQLDEETGEELSDEELSGEELTEDESTVWQSDWIRYNGTVYEYNSEILTFLVMGIDQTEEVVSSDNALLGGQADALFLIIMDPTEKEISLLAINRATMTDIDVYDEDDNYLYTATGQICLQHGYGDGMEESCERQVDAVSNLLYDLTIHGYVSINMSAIPLINNSIGGVTLEALEDVPTSEVERKGVAYSSTDTMRNIVAGETYTLSGFEAYAYTKYRSIFEEASATNRLMRQKQYLQTFMSDMKDAIAEDITVVADLYNALVPYMVTNVDLAEVTYLASNISGYSLDFDNGIYELEGETITGESGSETGFDEFYVDDEALYELMLELFYTEVEV